MKELFKLMCMKKASDLLLSAGSPPLLKINGILEETKSETLEPHEIESLACGMLTKEQIEIFKRDKDLGFSFGIPQLSRFRMNLYIQRGAVSVSVRRIPFGIPAFDALGLPRIIKDFAMNKQQQIRVQLSLVFSGLITQQLIINKEENGLVLARAFLSSCRTVKKIRK